MIWESGEEKRGKLEKFPPEGPATIEKITSLPIKSIDDTHFKLLS